MLTFRLPSATSAPAHMPNDSQPSADVYAGDMADPHDGALSPTQIYIFFVHADAEPDTFGRIANVFNIANAAPQCATLRRESDDQLSMTVTVAVQLANTMAADMIRRKLAQLTCVLAVELTSVNLGSATTGGEFDRQ